MKLIKGISATTHIDRHGDQITVGALVKGAEEANTFYYPLGVNHDPRVPPIGRIIKSFVVPQDDGHAVLKFVAQQFEDGDNFDLAASNKRWAPKLFSVDAEIIYDNSLEDPEFTKAVLELASVLHLKVSKQTKKAFDPLTVIILCLSLTAGGFFKSMGSDLYALVKKNLSKLMKRGAKERVLVIRCEMSRGGKKIQVDIFSTNPTEKRVNALLCTKEHTINVELLSCFPSPNFVKVVAEFAEGKIVPKFAVRVDGVPFDISGRVISYKGELAPGFSISFQGSEEEEG